MPQLTIPYNYTFQELATLTDGDERAAAEKRVKMRTMGVVRLISELYRKDVVRENIILVCIRELLEMGNPKSVPPEVRGGLRGWGLGAWVAVKAC